MALLHLKRMFFPKSPRQQIYTPLRSPSSDDLECQRSVSSSSTLTCNTLLESNSTEKPSPTSHTVVESKDCSTSSTSSSSRLLSPRTISDATLGLSDGLTVPFALTAGLSHFNSSRIVIYGGLAELLAGSISMGLGGYLGAKSEAESAQNSRKEFERMWTADRESMSRTVRESVEGMELGEVLEGQVVEWMMGKKRRAIDFLVRSRGGDGEWDGRRAYFSAITIAASYFVGGFVPLLPYFLVPKILRALYVSIAVMAVALFWFGYFKTRLVGEKRMWSNLCGGLQMLLLGGVAAAVSVGCVKLGGFLEDTGG